MKKFMKLLAGLLGLQALATAENSVELSEDQRASLTSMLGEDKAANLIAEANRELAEIEDAKTQLASIQQTAETAQTENVELSTELTELRNQLSQRDGIIAALKDTPDTAVQRLAASAGKIGAGLAMVFATAGQLMGYEGKLWSTDAPWNARALAGAQGSTTNFKSSVAIEKLNDSFEAFAIANPAKIESLFSNYFPLPAHWPLITGVSDRQISAQIVVGEVTQGRKAKWAPKGNVTIKPEEMVVRPTQIDLQFNYWEMQKIETNWLQQFNREGSQAYKMTFVEYLLTEFTKKARAEDADVLINGVYVPPPMPEDGQDQRPSAYIFRNDGIRKQASDARAAGKYRAFNVGTPTAANVVDYIDGIISKIPADVRNSPLQLILSPSHLRAYKHRYEDLFGNNNDYKGMPDTPRDYPNVTFVPLQQLEGSDFMMLTFMDNIKVFEYKPEEKAMYTVEKFLRDIYVFADYKIGIGINHIGITVAEGTEHAETFQAIWTNNVPALSASFFAVAYDDKNGILKPYHYRTYVDRAFTTNITKIDYAGDYLVIRGDISLGTDVLVKKSASLDLTADFHLKTGGELTLVKDGDKFREISRTEKAPVVHTAESFTTAALEYKADEYTFDGSAATTLSKIIGGAEGNKVRIHGGANALTIDNVSGNIKINGTAYVMDDQAKFMDLLFIGGQWVEVARG